jgi:antitoxin HicB
MANPYSGSNFDDFLAEEGILEEVSARALKRLLALQLAEIMETTRINKSQLAESLQTSRAQVDRLLDPGNTAITLASLNRLAHAVGKQLRIEFA